MSWSLPVNLKLKLSDAWTKCLEMLANSNSFLSAADSVLAGRVPNEDHSDNAVESWELVLCILGEEEAVEEDRELKLVPIFSSLPSILQLRLMFFLRSNISKVSSCSVQQFLEKVDSCHKDVWMKEAACQIRNDLARLKAETNQLKEGTVANYAFTSESYNAFQNIVRKLRTEPFECWQRSSVSTKLEKGTEATIGKIGVSNSTEDISVKSTSYSISSHNPTAKNTASSFAHLSEKTTDIIIIDDDSVDSEAAVNDHSSTIPVDNTANEGFSDTVDTCVKDSKEKLDTAYTGNVYRSSRGNNKQPAASECITMSNKAISRKQKTTVSVKPNLQAPESPAADSSLGGVQNLKEDRKRKFTEIQTETEDLVMCPVPVKRSFTNKIIKIEAEEDLAVEAKSTTSAEVLVQPDIVADSVVELPGNIMLHLDSIREACSSKENAFVIGKDLMNCFLEMKIAEIKMACTYLGLPHFSENALVNFCDSVPWTSLENESTVVLLDCCFTSKLQNLESQASRTLMMSLHSVSRVQPKALISVLAHILQVTHSGEFQCQVLNSVCNDFIPPEYFGFILRQLSMEGPIMNEYLVNVLQTILDKGADLHTDSLNYLHSLLTSGCQDVSSSAKFGRLLMAVLRKYLKKMSSQQVITVCALVESHNSSFRKQLQALVKRCT